MAGPFWDLSSIDMRTWMQLGTVAGGEVVSSDQY